MCVCVCNKIIYWSRYDKYLLKVETHLGESQKIKSTFIQNRLFFWQILASEVNSLSYISESGHPFVMQMNALVITPIYIQYTVLPHNFQDSPHTIILNSFYIQMPFPTQIYCFSKLLKGFVLFNNYLKHTTQPRPTFTRMKRNVFSV